MSRKHAKDDAERQAGALELDEIYSAEQLSPALAALYSELDIEETGQVKVFVSKLLDNGKDARIWQGPPADYDVVALSKRFGSGDYRVKVYVPRGDDRAPVMRGNKVFTMVLDPAEDASLKREREGTLQPHSGAVLTAETIAAAVTQAIKAALPAPVAPAVNPLDIIKGLADVFKNMMPAQPQGLNALDALKTAASIFKEMRGPDDEREPLDRGVNASGMDVFMKLIDKFGPALLAAAGQPQPQPGQPALPAPAPAQAAGNAQPAEDEAMIKFRMALAFLVQQAQADNDPTTYAGMILDNIAEPDLDTLLKNEQWLEYLASFEPRVMNQQKWFKELRDAVIELRKPDDGEPARDALTGTPESGKTH